MTTQLGPRDNNWDDLRFVLALQRHGTIAAAARSLDVTEVTVSRRLKQVERCFGTRLFERERGRVTPTREALVLIDRLIVIGDEIDALRDAIGDADRSVSGVVRVTGVSTLVNRVLAPRLPELLARYPGLELELIVDTTMLGITYQRETDIAVRLRRPVTEPDAIVKKIGDMACGIYANKAINSSDPRVGWVGYARRSAQLPHAEWIEEQRLAEQGIARVRVDDAETLMQCVRAGLGKSLLPVAFGSRFPELSRLDDGDSVPDREMWILMHPSVREVRRIEVVTGWLSETLREWLGPDRQMRPAALARIR